MLIGYLEKKKKNLNDSDDNVRLLENDNTIRRSSRSENDRRWGTSIREKPINLQGTTLRLKHY